MPSTQEEIQAMYDRSNRQDEMMARLTGNPVGISTGAYFGPTDAGSRQRALAQMPPQIAAQYQGGGFRPTMSSGYSPMGGMFFPQIMSPFMGMGMGGYGGLNPMMGNMRPQMPAPNTPPPAAETGVSTGVYTVADAAADAAARERFPELYKQQQSLMDQQHARFRQFFGNNPANGAPVPPGFMEQPSASPLATAPEQGLQRPMMGGYSGFNPMMGMMGGYGGFNPMMGMMGGYGGFNPMMGMMGGYGGFNPMMGMMGGLGPMMGGYGGYGGGSQMGGNMFSGIGALLQSRPQMDRGNMFRGPSNPNQGGAMLQSDPYNFRGQSNQTQTQPSVGQATQAGASAGLF